MLVMRLASLNLLALISCICMSLHLHVISRAKLYVSNTKIYRKHTSMVHVSVKLKLSSTIASDSILMEIKRHILTVIT